MGSFFVCQFGIILEIVLAFFLGRFLRRFGIDIFYSGGVQGEDDVLYDFCMKKLISDKTTA